MSCLGGTNDEPRPWIRLRSDGTILSRQEGRYACENARRNPDRTSRRWCSECPAFRGRRADGRIATGLYPDGSPYALSEQEYAEWETAMEAVLIDDDFSLLAAFQLRLAEGIGDQALRAIGDPDALERRAAYMRRYRAEKGSGSSKERVRRLRQRRKEAAGV